VCRRRAAVVRVLRSQRNPAPNTGIVDYGRVAQAIAAELDGTGVDLRCGVAVASIDPGGDRAVVHTASGPLTARTVIVCAGLWADRLARRAGAPRDPQIVPFRGAYLVLKPTPSHATGLAVAAAHATDLAVAAAHATDLAVAATPWLNGMIYPVPDPELPFLGVHITTHITGEVTLGPTAMMVAARDAYTWRISGRDAWETLTWPGTWRVARKHWRVGIDEIRMAASRRAFVAAAARYLPGLSIDDLSGHAHAGVRAQAVGRDGALVDDFVFSHQQRVTHVRNAPSPAATSAFALAREVVDRVMAQKW
jgi:L-2-hydroxyglutarate oxidase LhgO